MSCQTANKTDFYAVYISYTAVPCIRVAYMHQYVKYVHKFWYRYLYLSVVNKSLCVYLVAESFLGAKKLNVLKQVFSVRRPFVIEEPKDVSPENLAVLDSQARHSIHAADSVPEEKEDAAQREVPGNKDNEDEQLKNKVGNEKENESKQSQEETGRDGREKEDEEHHKDKEEEEKLKRAEEKTEEKQTDDEEQKKEIQNEDELRNKEKERKEDQGKDELEEFKVQTESKKQRKEDGETQDNIKPKESDDEDEDEEKKEGKTRSESGAAGTAAAKEEDKESKRGATRDAGQSAVDDDSLNTDKLSIENAVTVHSAETTCSEKSEGKQTSKTEKAADDEYVLLNPPLELPPERKDEIDTSGSEPSSSLDTMKSPKSIIVKGVSSHTVDVVEVFLESPKKGGGPVKEFKFSESDGELSVIFEDELGMLHNKVHCNSFSEIVLSIWYCLSFYWSRKVLFIRHSEIKQY